MPGMLYRGIWKHGVEYERGDCVTRDGSVWHCNADKTTLQPGGQGGNDWQLCAKRGNHGKDGAPGPQGPKGDPGKNATGL